MVLFNLLFLKSDLPEIIIGVRKIHGLEGDHRRVCKYQARPDRRAFIAAPTFIEDNCHVITRTFRCNDPPCDT